VETIFWLVYTGASAEVRRYQIVGIELEIVDGDTPYSFLLPLKKKTAVQTAESSTRGGGFCLYRRGFNRRVF
jgi:hypothetical protein